MPSVGEPVNFTWNVRTAFIGRILVTRSGGGTVHSVHDQTYPALPTSISGAFFDNPGAGTWLYILIYTASLDPDVGVEFYEVVDSVTVVWPTEDTTDGSWSFLRQRNPPASEDGDWSQIEPSPVPPTIDSNWSSLRSISPASEPSTDGEWSLIRSVAADGSTTDSPWTLLHVILPPFDAENRPPIVHPQQPEQISRVIIDGGGRNTGGGAAYSGEDPDPGDTIVRWEATMSYPGWRVEALGGGGFNNFATFDIYQDYFGRFSEYEGRQGTPANMLRSREFRVRCRDNHQAWSEYETMLINVVQPVHGDNLQVDGFTERPDRRQPNIWAFRHGSTRNASVGGVHYQYLTPADARASRALWAGSISYAAYRLYELIQGTEPNVVVHNYRNIHPSLNAVLVDGLITFTLKPDAELTEVGEYTSSHNWTVLGEVLIDGGGAGNPDFWAYITGFLFISGDLTEDSDWSSVASATPTNDSDWSFLRRVVPGLTTDSRWGPVTRLTFFGTTDSEWSDIDFRTPLPALLPTIDIKANNQDVLEVVAGTQVSISWVATNALSVTLDLLGDGIPPVTGHPLTGSFASIFTIVGTHIYQATAIGAGGTATDTVEITVTPAILPTTDSQWSGVTTIGVSPTTDSDWSDLGATGPTTDSQWSLIQSLSAVLGETIDGQWSSLVPIEPIGDRETFIRSNNYFPCHDEGVRITWGVNGARTSDEFAVLEDGDVLASRGASVHDGTWSGSRLRPSMYRPGGNTVTYTIRVTRRSTVRVIDQAEVARLRAERERVQAAFTAAQAVLVSRLSARSAARRTHNSAVSATTTAQTTLAAADRAAASAQTTYDSAVSATSSALSDLRSGQNILRTAQMATTDARSALASAQSTYTSALSAYNSDLSALNSCYADHPPEDQAVECASEYSAAQSSFATATSAFNAQESAEDALDDALDAQQIANDAIPGLLSALTSARTAEASALTALNTANSTAASALTAYNSATSAEASALTALNSAESAYDSQLSIVNGLIDDRADIDFDLEGALLGVIMVVHTTVVSESIEVAWVFCDPTTDSDWSQLNTDLETSDSDWSPVVSGLETVDGDWSQPIGLLTRDSDWSQLNTDLETTDSDWSDVIGPVVCDGFWSPFALLVNEDSEWSELFGLLTQNSRWSDIVGPVVCDGPWGPFATLLDVGQDSEWSLVFELLYENSEWSAVSNVAYSVRGSLSRLASDGQWTKVSSAAYNARPGASERIVYRGKWSAVSNVAYRIRTSAVAGLVYRSPWTAVSGPAYRVRPAAPTLIYYAPWSAVSNTAYRVLPGAPAQIVYHSAWTAVSNTARQEREVLSAIGGAVPFLHIYEARRGLVQVRRLVTSTGNLFSDGLEEALTDTDRDNDRAIINPGITYGDVLSGDVTLQVYRTSRTAALDPSSFRFYLANMEGVDPNFQRVYYDVTPGSIVMGLIAHHVEVTATATGIIYQKRDAENNNVGASVEFSFGGVVVPTSAEVVVVALTPQHDNEGLSRIVYQQAQVGNWYYYHGVPEIYVSEPVDIVADEDAFSYNGRDSANFQSPPHVGYASALVRQHQNTDRPWFEELLNRNHVITGQRVHILLRDNEGHYGKDFTGILQSPPLQHQDNIYDWRVTLQDPTTLMVQSFANSATLLGPQDAVSARTVGALIRTVCRAYADRVAGLDIDDVLDPNFDPDDFPVPLAWFWTDYESERDILQRLVNTQGPPTGFYVNNLGQLTFTGCEDRASPIQIGGATGIPVSQLVSFSDHVVDVANDARIPVSLHGWVLPDIATAPAQIYEEPNGLPEAVQVQLFETYSDNAIFDLARGGGITFDVNGEYRYRVRTGSPVLPPTKDMPFRITGDGTNVTINQIAANLLEIVVTGTAGDAVPSFQVLGAELKHFRTIENWTSQTVREENQTRFSRYLYHQREFSYGGYNSIAVRDAQLLADWVVRYYRKGIKTMTLQLFCSNHVQEALRLEPDRTPVRVAHNYGAGAPEQWIVRSRKRVYRDGHFWVDVVLDEDVMYSLGLEHSPLCAAYVAPDPASSATYAVGNAGELTYTGTVGAALAIPQQGFLSAAPDLAATVLPIARAADTATVLTHYSGVPLFQISGDFISAHFDLTRLEALNDSAFYADGLRANGLSLWLAEPKVDGDPYWAVAAFNFRADGFDGELPAVFHFLRVRYAALGAHSDVVLSFVAPNTTIHDVANHWITVAQEQPWLDEDAAAALLLHQHVIILDWQAFPMDAPVGFAGLLESPAYVNDAVVAADAMPSTNVGGANGAQIARRFGRA